MSPLIQRLAPRPQPEPEFRHLIARYVHRTRLVQCTCGFEGGSEGTYGGPSEWTRHVKDTRPAGRS